MQQIAEIFDRHVRQVGVWRKEGCPSEKDGKRVYMDSRAVHDWLVEREVNRTRAEFARDPAGDLEGAGADSPALERYRLARAIKAERENAEAEGRVVEIAKIAADLLKAAQPLRAAIERLERGRFGAAGKKAVDVIEAALRKAQEVIAA